MSFGLTSAVFGGLYPHAEAVFPLDSTAAAALLSAPGLIEKLTLFVEFMTVMLFISILAGIVASSLLLQRILQGYRRTTLRLIRSSPSGLGKCRRFIIKGRERR
mmetsp:Transcript_51096/g.128234  ORF Transcript_51096/g.128234 Transcript_51096/m.128234 type:complete len:104 (-) Transcript_51096:4-315(-)